MITQRKHHLGPDVSPQAIFWRPIHYFSNVVMDDEDELDNFKFVSFALDNHVFDLRVYLQHPNMTVTLYLPIDIVSDESVRSKIHAASMVLNMPDYAIAWQRGDELKFGELRRKGNDRLTEREARLLVLKIAASSDGHRSSTSMIKKAIPEFFELSPLDLKISETRKNEKMWQQIVRNVKAHHAGPSSIFSKGWAEPTPDGIEVTHAGLNYLKSIGFSLDLA
jgi:hypothetical protein